VTTIVSVQVSVVDEDVEPEVGVSGREVEVIVD
jgi:hypothetical protein